MNGSELTERPACSHFVLMDSIGPKAIFRRPGLSKKNFSRGQLSPYAAVAAALVAILHRAHADQKRGRADPVTGNRPAGVDIAAKGARGLASEAIWPRYLNFRLLRTSADRGIGARL
jgi:hypothetical protein